MSKKARVFSREFKLMVVRRMVAGENVSALAREVKIDAKTVYVWRDRYRSGGAEALRGSGRPRKATSSASAPGANAKAAEATPAAELEAARKRISELERKIGQQQVDLDFFQQALRHVRDTRQRNTKPGATGSTRSSKR
jgi:transposase